MDTVGKKILSIAWRIPFIGGRKYGQLMARDKQFLSIVWRRLFLHWVDYRSVWTVTALLFTQADTPQQATPLIVQRLISLTSGATLGELTSLGEMISQLMKGKHIPNDCYQHVVEHIYWKVCKQIEIESNRPSQTEIKSCTCM